MILKWLFRILLAPFSLLYGIGVSIHQLLYKTGLLKSVTFNVPVISVGNLSVGGAGKTPHVEYLIRLLKDYINVATLSRGYKRKTKGFRIAHPRNTAEDVGDEPLQYKRKYADVVVSVAESRVMAVPEIMKFFPDTQTILLDDAFQHRAINPGLNILLTEYNHPFTDDFLMPAGRLREWRSNYKRADIIIVSKCPPTLVEAEKEKWINKINPLPHQRLFFSYYAYGLPYYIFNPRFRGHLKDDIDILLVCAIARSEYLISYLEEQVNSIVLLEFEDHHYFTKQDMSAIRATYERMDSKRKVIITTEKDAMRLDLHREFLVEHKLPVYALPVQVQFHFNEGLIFNQTVQNFLLEFKV